MTILIDLDNQVMAGAICQLLTANGHDDVVVSGKSPTDGISPRVLLVDISTLTYDLLARYPQARAFLIDEAAIEPEKLCAALLLYTIHGVLSLHAGLQQVWIDNGSVKALRHDAGTISRPVKVNGITGREQQIIACICRGLSDKEIAQRLTLSERTMKSHLSRIFSKFRIRSRSRLIAMAMQGLIARST